MKFFKRSIMSLTLLLLFMSAIPALAQPTLIAPPNMSTCILPMNVQFAWLEYPSALSYRLVISTTADFSDIVFDQATALDTLSVNLPSNDQTYYWKVVALTSPGPPPVEEESQTWSLRTIKTAPNQVEPSNNNLCANKTQLFKWSRITNATYTFQLSDNVDFSNLIENRTDLPDTSVTIVLPNYYTKYYWRVNAAYDNCVTLFSEPDSFVTQREPATLVSPDNNTNSVPRTGIRLTWSSNVTPSNYIMQVSNNEQFTSILYEYIGTNTSDSIFSLSYNIDYFWRVRMDYNGCYTEWTAPRRFRTEYPRPQNLIPRQDSLCVPLIARLRWDFDPEAITYRVQISEDFDFSTLILDSTDININFMNFVFSKPLKTYFWRVKVQDDNNSSQWSEINALTTAVGYPELIAPTDGNQNLPVSVVFKWTKPTPYTRERLQISTDPTFATVLFDLRSLDKDSIVVTMPEQFQTYYWRMNSDLETCVSAWSPARSFRTVLLPPNLVYPENNSTDHAQAITFEWSAAEGATAYQIIISPNMDFSDDVNNIGRNGIPSTKFYVTTLKPSTKYYWKVTSVNDRGMSDPSTIFSFTTSAEALSAPTLVSPPPGAKKIPVNKVNLVWNPVDRATKYMLQVALDPDFNNIVFEQPDHPDTLYTFTSMNYLTIYYWRVRAENDLLVSNWSPRWSFETVIEAPSDAPILVRPENNLTSAPTEITFEWQPVDRAENYELEIATDALFNDVVISDTNIFNPTKYISNLLFETTMYWHVRAKNYAGKGPWSNSRTFTTLINSVDEELASEYQATVTPNPVSGIANLSFNLPKHQFVGIYLFNNIGSMISVLNHSQLSEGMHKLVLNSSKLDNGSYFINFIIGNKTFTLKFIVSK